MNDFDLSSFIFGIFSLFIVVAGISRLMTSNNSKTMIPNIVYWLLIFTTIIIFYAFKPEIKYGFSRLAAIIAPSYISESSGEDIITIARNIDGHFYIRTRVNNKKVKFMIDTGASDVALTIKDAKHLNIDISKLVFNKKYSTANGISFAAPVTLKKLQIGPITFKNVKAHVNEGGLDVSLLGMSVISKFNSFTIDGDFLILEY